MSLNCQALQRTVEFEKELEKKFGGGVPTKDIEDDIEEIGTWEDNSQNISKIRKKYEKKFAASQESEENVYSMFLFYIMENTLVIVY